MERDHEFDIKSLFGKWFILYSNFPMWTSGKRKSPSLNYHKRIGSNKYNVVDTVEYYSNGQLKTINGFDQYLGDHKFQWKGKGILALLRSKWEIVHFENDWMLIYFEKTLFTPEGYDLISTSNVHHQAMQNKLEELNLQLTKIDQEQD